MRRARARPPSGFGLGAEVLDDHFLDMAVALVEIANREQALRALGRRFADAEQNPGGEGNPQLAGFVDHPHAQAGSLSGAH